MAGQHLEYISSRLACKMKSTKYLDNIGNLNGYGIMEDGCGIMSNGTNGRRGYLQCSASFPIASLAELRIFSSESLSISMI
jgi:hypothetical protein